MDDPCRGPRALPQRSDEDRLHLAAKLYLSECYAARTAARADELAQKLRVSRFHLRRKAAGASLHGILRQHQLDHARRLLLTTTLPIDEVAVASAFGTSWTFCRHFKAAFGITPGVYRRTCHAANLPAQNAGGELCSRRLSRR